MNEDQVRIVARLTTTEREKLQAVAAVRRCSLTAAASALLADALDRVSA